MKRLAAQKAYRNRPGRACRYAAAGCAGTAIPGAHSCKKHARQERRSSYYASRDARQLRLAEAQGWICPWDGCWQPILPGDQVEIDHIIPIASGIVINEEWNLQVLHWQCNRSKKDKITAQAILLAAAHGVGLAAA